LSGKLAVWTARGMRPAPRVPGALGHRTFLCVPGSPRRPGLEAVAGAQANLSTCASGVGDRWKPNMLGELATDLPRFCVCPEVVETGPSSRRRMLTLLPLRSDGVTFWCVGSTECHEILIVARRALRARAFLLTVDGMRGIFCVLRFLVIS
jgi:hypothetical protein